MTSDTRSSVSCSMPFVALTMQRLPRNERRGRSDHRPGAVRRQRRKHDIRAMKRFFERGRRRNASRQHDIGQVHRIGSPRFHLFNEVRVSPPQPHVVPCVGEMKRKRRPPASRSENRDFFHALCPSLRSMPANTRRRFDRCR